MTKILVLAATSLLLLAFVPTTEARQQVCTSLADASCPGEVCQDSNGDAVYARSECKNAEDVRELLDPCAFQSDCCGGYSFWCPETE